MNLKYIKELKSDTWLNASRKSLDNGQNRRTYKFYNKYKEEKEKEDLEKYLKIPLVQELIKLDDYENSKNNDVNTLILNNLYDNYIFSVFIESIEFDGGDFIKINNHLKMKIYAYYDMGIDNEYCLLPIFQYKDIVKYMSYNNIKIYDNNTIQDYYFVSRIELGTKNPYFNLDGNIIGKLSNRNEVLKFLKMLNQLYEAQNPKLLSNIYSKLNDVDKEFSFKGGHFYNYVKDNFGTFEDFKKDFSIYESYDSY
jgi:hypothetical protein